MSKYNFDTTFNIKEYIVDRKRIGKGSFSTIYKCRHYNSDKEYALKEITIDKNKNKLNIKREFEIMRKLNHENIVKIHDVIIDKHLNNIYFIMDYYEYGDLSNFLNKKPLKEKFTRKYIKQLSNGLSYLLDNNILHRDLKPQNILLSRNYDIKITDFGFATYYNKDTIINTLCGSPMYMAPEIITRNGYDYKSDLWSVGIIMYEMIHGYTPFNVHNFIDLIKEIKKKNIVVKVEVSEECLELIYSLCKINPNERISWNDFFDHKWFNNNEIEADENKLFDIKFNESLPNINNFNHNEKQFCSFTHKSIVSDEEEYKNDYVNKNKFNNLEFNFLEESEEYLSAEDTHFTEYESDNESEPISKEHEESKEINIDIPHSFVEVDPINIPQKHNEFIFINPDDLATLSLPNRKKTLTESFRDYLYSSMQLIRHSYDYMSNNSI